MAKKIKSSVSVIGFGKSPPQSTGGNFTLLSMYSLPIKYTFGKDKARHSLAYARDEDMFIINKYEYRVYARTTYNLKRLADKINERHALEQKNPEKKKISLSLYHRFFSVISAIMGYYEIQTDPYMARTVIRFNDSLTTINLYPGNSCLSVYVSINIFIDSLITDMNLTYYRVRTRHLLHMQRRIYKLREENDRIFFLIDRLKNVSDEMMLEYFKRLPIKKADKNKLI